MVAGSVMDVASSLSCSLTVRSQGVCLWATGNYDIYKIFMRVILVSSITRVSLSVYGNTGHHVGTKHNLPDLYWKSLVTLIN